MPSEISSFTCCPQLVRCWSLSWWIHHPSLIIPSWYPLLCLPLTVARPWPTSTHSRSVSIRKKPPIDGYTLYFRWWCSFRIWYIYSLVVVSGGKLCEYLLVMVVLSPTYGIFAGASALAFGPSLGTSSSSSSSGVVSALNVNGVHLSRFAALLFPGYALYRCTFEASKVVIAFV